MKISVLTPTYNRPELLRQTIESFLMQDYPDKEMIVVNDGSDRSYEDIVLEYCKPEYNNIIYFTGFDENKGCPSALNLGIENSTGELITIIADDDLLFNSKSLSERAFWLINNPEVDVVYSGFACIDGSGKITEVHEAIPPNKELIWKRDYINVQSMMWRKSIHDKIGMFSEDLINNEDWEFKIKCLMELNVQAIAPITVKSRYHGGNKSIVNRDMTNKCGAMILERMKEKYDTL